MIKKFAENMFYLYNLNYLFKSQNICIVQIDQNHITRMVREYGCIKLSVHTQETE